MSTATNAERVTEEELIRTLDDADGGLRTRELADHLPAGRGRIRSRLQALADRGLVVRRGERTRAVWALTDAGQDRLGAGPRLLPDGGDTDDGGDRFDPDVEEIPVEIGEPGEWGAEEFGLDKWKLIGGALVAILAIVVVLYALRKVKNFKG